MAGSPVRRSSEIPTPVLWNTGSPAFTGDDDGVCVYALATRCVRVVRKQPPKNRGRGATLKSEGAGNAGCPKHPRPVCESSVHTVVTTVAPEHPAFPHAMVLTAYATLSPATNSSCHRRRRIGGVANPGWARNTSAGLAPATGARTTWFCRTRPVFARRLRRHVHVRPSIDEAGSSIVRPRAGPMLTGTRSIERPPCNALRDDAAASTASRPNVRDDGQRPSFGTGWRGTKG